MFDLLANIFTVGLLVLAALVMWWQYKPEMEANMACHCFKSAQDYFNACVILRDAKEKLRCDRLRNKVDHITYIHASYLLEDAMNYVTTYSPCKDEMEASHG